MTTANLSGYDSVAATVAEWRAIVPEPGPEVIGSYRNGQYANNTVAKQAFPHSRHIDYDVNGSAPAACLLDIEASDAVPGQAAPWARKWLAIGAKAHAIPKPGDYASASVVAAVISDMLDGGFSRDQFLIHSAHYGQGEHICGPGQCPYPQADGTQWANHGLSGQDTDLNLFFPHFFGIAPRPKVDPHYGWFDTRPRRIVGGRSELAVVKEYDHLRATQSATSHPHRAELALLRVELRLLAARLAPLPELGKFHREWRLRELRDRASGRRLV